MTAKKNQELATIKLAILSLSQCISMQLKAKLNVPVDDSHRQLDMVDVVEPSQTPSPCPERGAVMTLSCPKGEGSAVKSMCPTHTCLFTWALLGMGNGQTTPCKPVFSKEAEQGVGPHGGRRSETQAGWGTGCRACRSTRSQGLVSFTLALNSDSSMKAHSGGADPARQMPTLLLCLITEICPPKGPTSSPLPPVHTPALSSAISLPHPRFSSISKTT